MSAPHVSTAGLMPDVPATTVVRSYKAPIALAAFAILFALLVLLAPRTGQATLRLSNDSDAIQLPALSLPVAATGWVCLVLMLLLTAGALYFVRAQGRAPLWIVIVYILVAIVGFLGWAAAGATIPVVGLLAGAVALAVPLIYGALGGVIGERAGVVNIAI